MTGITKSVDMKPKRHNKTIRLKKMQKGAGIHASDVSTYLFKYPKITTEPNRNAAELPLGVIHVTDSAGINAARTFGTGISNFFGSKGFDNKIYDDLRNSVLNKLKTVMEVGNIDKVCNLRMEMDSTHPSLILANIYGTAYGKSK